MAKVYMIDDNPMEHLIANKMLGKYISPIEISHSTDARLALDFFEKNSRDVSVLPDMILLDLNMPHFSGWDFLESFKHLEDGLIKPVDVIILTSSINTSDIDFCKKFTCVKFYFVKPITPNNIQQIFPSAIH